MNSPSDSVKLVVQTGPAAGQTFAVGAYPQVIGRGASVDIHLPEQTLSRHHAKIQATARGCVVEDLGSTNGTFVNGQRLTAPTVCRNGDVIQVGDVVTMTVQMTQSNLDYMPTMADFDAPGFGAPGYEPTIAPGSPVMPAGYPAAPARQSSNRTAWLVVGVVVTLVLLIVGVGLAMLYFTNAYQPAAPTIDPASLLMTPTPAAPPTDTPAPAETAIAAVPTPTEAPVSVPGIPAALARELPIPGSFVNQISPFCANTIEINPDEPVLLSWTQRLAPFDGETDYKTKWLESVYYDITLNGQPVTDRGTLNYTVDGSSLTWWMNLGLIEPGLHYLRIQWYASRKVSTGLDLEPADGQVDTYGPGAAGQGYCALSVPETEVTAKTTYTPEMPTPTSTPLVSPTAAAPATAQPVAVAPAPPGIFDDFEQAATWKRGDQPYGTFDRSSGQVHSGSYAGQLNYSFPTGNNDYVVFLKNRALAGRPNAISAWVYGDNSGHYLNIWIKDAGGQSWQMSLGQIKHTGWREMVAPLDPAQPWPAGHISGPNNGAIDYPITFQAIVLDDIPDTYSGSGTIYIDDLTSREGAVVPPPTQVTVQPSQPSGPVRSTIYALSMGSQHLYEEPWGAPIGSPCEAFRNNSWDNKNPNFRGFNVELILTNKSAVKIQDDWGEEMRFITNTGGEVTACYYGYDGAGPPPQGSTSLTFFTVVPKGEFVQTMQLNLNGEFLQICLDGRGGWNPC